MATADTCPSAHHPLPILLRNGPRVTPVSTFHAWLSSRDRPRAGRAARAHDQALLGSRARTMPGKEVSEESAGGFWKGLLLQGDAPGRGGPFLALPFPGDRLRGAWHLRPSPAGRQHEEVPFQASLSNVLCQKWKDSRMARHLRIQSVGQRQAMLQEGQGSSRRRGEKQSSRAHLALLGPDGACGYLPAEKAKPWDSRFITNFTRSFQEHFIRARLCAIIVASSQRGGSLLFSSSPGLLLTGLLLLFLSTQIFSTRKVFNSRFTLGDPLPLRKNVSFAGHTAVFNG